MMPLSRKTTLLLFCGIVIAFTGLISCKNNSKPTSPEAKLLFESVIPKPEKAVALGKTFFLEKDAEILTDSSSEANALGQYLAEMLNTPTGFHIPVKTLGTPTIGDIVLKIEKSDSIGIEGYKLSIQEDLIQLSAPNSAGLFNGIQTLRQLFPEKIELKSVQQGPWEIATGTIQDQPAYSWRGSMLDVARHFFSVEEVKRYIDLLAAYKMNVLHLHLSDDQGWRIEIKSWPNLAVHGGSTEVGGGEGGYYSQEQFKDIVNYAHQRYITVIPEVDLPGHINAAMASYPEINCNGKATELYTGREVGFSSLCLKNKETFRFVDDVIRELADITPGPCIHIGGDEAESTKKEDYIAFINKFQEIVEAHGKRMMGWEEIAQGKLSRSTVVQHWKHGKFARQAADKKLKIVMSPATRAYLDMQYDSTSKFGSHWAAYIEVDSAYLWDPVAQVTGLTKDDVVGLEAPIWSETVSTIHEVEYLLFPRLPGIAEVGWTKRSLRNWDDYKVRLGNHARRMKAMNIDYYRSAKVPWVD
jgi:hexosaminidase